MRELERRRAQEAADRVFAQKQQQQEEDEDEDEWFPTKSTSSFHYTAPLSIQLPNTLNPLERQRPGTPDMMTPMGAEFQPPTRAVPLSYEGALSSKEAMVQPYRGADESLPPQQVASGEQMRPQSNSASMAASSAFIPLGASVPESLNESLGRSTSLSAPYTIPGTTQRVIRRPVTAAQAAKAAAKAAPAAAPL
jgi:hypothetical protein